MEFAKSDVAFATAQVSARKAELETISSRVWATKISWRARLGYVRASADAWRAEVFGGWWLFCARASATGRRDRVRDISISQLVHRRILPSFLSPSETLYLDTTTALQGRAGSSSCGRRAAIKAGVVHTSLVESDEKAFPVGCAAFAAVDRSIDNDIIFRHLWQRYGRYHAQAFRALLRVKRGYPLRYKAESGRVCQFKAGAGRYGFTPARLARVLGLLLGCSLEFAQGILADIKGVMQVYDASGRLS